MQIYIVVGKQSYAPSTVLAAFYKYSDAADYSRDPKNNDGSYSYLDVVVTDIK